ncbi:MAG: DUF624 domain-containing protein [Ruminococcaceae bacterium]|nr:DUF624 domain-containing protein [Oscillospiraceae bacterium]HHV32600.1 YesL family protein [Clostridiales bacterium]
MGLFSNHYSRPGPGVSKNEPKKKPFFLFWELYFRKFWDLIKLNLLFCIPVVAVLALVYFMGRFTGDTYFVYLPVILLSPFCAGLCFVTRNYAREEHAFIFSDFKEAIQKNWLYFLINGAIVFVAYFILSVAISYYSSHVSDNWIFFIPLSLCIIVSTLFLFAQYYFSVMAITFDLKLKDLYKNSFIFSILGLWRNLLLTVILAVLLFIMYILFNYSPLTIIIGILLLAFLFFSLCMFLINFTVYPLIDKIMIQPYQKKEEENDSDFDD